MTVENGSGGGTRKFFASLPTGVWALIIGQFLTLVVWAIRLDKRVEDNEKLITRTLQQDTVPGQLLKQRFELMDDRQRYLLNYVLFLREEIARKPGPPSGTAPPLMSPPPMPSTPAAPSEDTPTAPSPNP